MSVILGPQSRPPHLPCLADGRSEHYGEGFGGEEVKEDEEG